MKNLLIAFMLAGALLFAPKLSAAQTEFREISLTPFLQELEVAKGGAVQSSIDVTNNSAEEIVAYISTRDFLPGQRGEPQFVPDDEYNEVTFSLASWITIADGNQVHLRPGETKTIRYSVNPPANAEQGTHYGAILFSLTEGANLSGVGITQSVGTIVIVGYGEARPQGELEFSAEPTVVWWNDKIEFTNTFKNIGRVHVKPKGEVVIKNIFGQVVATPQTNRDAANVLPESDRSFISDWFPSRAAFGPYTAESVLTYGNSKLEVRDKETIWILPAYTLVLLGLVLIIILWFIFHGRHWNRRRVIKKHLN